MVKAQEKPELFEALFPKKRIKWAEVSLSDVLHRGKRLEGTYFDVEAKKARQLIENFRGDKVLISQLLENSFVPPQLKRTFTNNNNIGTEYITPSELLCLDIKPRKYVIAEKMKDIENWYVKRTWLIITQSGLVGVPIIVTKTMEKYVISQNAIRLVFKNEIDALYVYAMLSSTIGRKIITTNIYGSVITHIEPEHVESLKIPNPSEPIKREIGEKILKAFLLRDKANQLLERAENLFYERLGLKRLSELKPTYLNNNNKVFRVKFSDIGKRLDGSFHNPISAAIIDELRKANVELTTCGDKRVSQNIILPGRFKRFYVEEDYGVPFLSGKNIFQMRPVDVKYLSRTKHKERLDELRLMEGIILVTRSGTVGRVILCPGYFENYAATEHILKLVSSKQINEGYIYCFLASDYGRVLIQKFIYGSVVDEIDDSHLASVPFPITHIKSIENEIGSLVVEANNKRNEAWELENEAIQEVEKLISM